MRYDYEPNRDDRTDNSRFRAVFIFIIALVVIGGGIYYFILPHTGTGSKNGAAVPPSANGPKTEGAAGDAKASAEGPKNPAGSTAPAPTGDTTNPTDATGSGTPPMTEQPPRTASGTDAPADGRSDLPGNDEAPAPAPTEYPQKGKPWAGDPRSEQPSASDKPAAAPQPPTDPAASSEIIVVQAGESLGRIAQKYHTTVEALRHYNKLKKDVIFVGQRLRVMPGPWRITVVQKQKVLKLERLRGGKWSEFAGFSVGLGRMASTPNAQFVISTRLRHPDWYTPDGRIYRYGDRENQLGDYFLKLATSGKPDKPLLGYGIHGTPDEKSVGKNWSNGCIRMRNCDVEILYYLVPSGTPVKIVPGADEPRKTEIEP